MTDAAVPAPDQPKSRRRLFIILAAVLVVVIALLVGSFLYASSAASSKASDYDDDYAAWKAKDKPILLAATARVPKGTYPTKGATTPKALATQKKGCDAVAGSRKKLTAAADRLPKMGSDGMLAKVSSDYSDAGTRSDRREATVRAYVKAASKALDQLERDCRWNIAFNTSTVRAAKSYDRSRDYLMQPGDREPGGVYCPGPNTCISSIKKKQKAYVRFRLAYVAQSRSDTLPLYGKKCEATSYGAACRIMTKSYDYVLKTERRTYDYIRTTNTTNNPRIHREFDRIDKATSRYVPDIREAVLALDPALKKDKQVRKYPGWSDHFFARMANVQLAGLKDERAAIAKL